MQSERHKNNDSLGKMGINCLLLSKIAIFYLLGGFSFHQSERPGSNQEGLKQQFSQINKWFGTGVWAITKTESICFLLVI